MENKNCACGNEVCSCSCGGVFSNKNIANALFVAVGLLAVFLLAKAMTEFKKYSYMGKEYPAQTTINVSGEGEVVAMPDLATFSVGVSEEGMTVELAQKKATELANNITRFLKESGVEERDIKTSGYNISPRYEYNTGYWCAENKWCPPNGKRNLVAYVVSQNFAVKIRKISDAGKIIGGLGELGPVEISALTFGFDKEKEMRETARAEAIKKANKDAEKIARDLGVRIVRIMNFYENQYFGDRIYGLGMGGGEAVKSVPEISTGEGKIVSSVNIVYEIR